MCIKGTIILCTNHSLATSLEDMHPVHRMADMGADTRLQVQPWSKVSSAAHNNKEMYTKCYLEWLGQLHTSYIHACTLAVG